VLAGGLAGLATAGLTACTGDDEPASPGRPHPDLLRAEAAVSRERRLVAAYDLAASRAPELAERLAPLRAEHLEHLAALGVTDLAAPATADPTADPTASPSPPPEPPPLPDDVGALLPALAELERGAAGEHAAVAVHCGRGLAVVLATAAASEASHPLALQ
jgi:hypothetical protein